MPLTQYRRRIATVVPRPGPGLRIKFQVGNQLPGPEWANFPPIDSIMTTPYILPSTMDELYESRTLLCGRRVDAVRAQY